MFATIIAKLKAALRSNTSVDEAVSGLTASLSKLEAVAAAKLKEHLGHTDVASAALQAADAAYADSQRAGRIHAAISALIA